MMKRWGASEMLISQVQALPVRRTVLVNSVLITRKLVRRSLAPLLPLVLVVRVFSNCVRPFISAPTILGHIVSEPHTQIVCVRKISCLPSSVHPFSSTWTDFKVNCSNCHCCQLCWSSSLTIVCVQQIRPTDRKNFLSTWNWSFCLFTLFTKSTQNEIWTNGPSVLYNLIILIPCPEIKDDFRQPSSPSQLSDWNFMHGRMAAWDQMCAVTSSWYHPPTCSDGWIDSWIWLIVNTGRIKHWPGGFAWPAVEIFLANFVSKIKFQLRLVSRQVADDCCPSRTANFVCRLTTKHGPRREQNILFGYSVFILPVFRYWFLFFFFFFETDQPQV